MLLCVGQAGMEQGVSLEAQLSREPRIAHHAEILLLLLLGGPLLGSTLLGSTCWDLLDLHVVCWLGDGWTGHGCLQMFVILYDAY